MRPRREWSFRRRRRSDRLWWTLVLSAGVIVIAALVVRNLPSGGGASSPVDQPSAARSSDVISYELRSAAPPDKCAAGEDCLPAPTAECLGSDCAVVAASSDDDASLPPSDYVVASETPPPAITSRSAAIMEQACGAILYGHRAHQRLAPASLTKIATALVAVDQSQLTEMVDVQVNGELLSASTKSSVMGLKPGQRLSMRDLLYGLLLPSGNDAGIAIAEHVGGSVPAFATLMNGKARELGLHNSRFTNPHGLDEKGLYTSAYDIAVLGRELLADPELAAIVATKTYQPGWDGPPVWNGNKLLYEYEGTVGVKTGTTPKARQTMVAAAQRNGRTLIVSVLGSEARYSDATSLFEWAFASTKSPCFG